MSVSKTIDELRKIFDDVSWLYAVLDRVVAKLEKALTRGSVFWLRRLSKQLERRCSELDSKLAEIQQRHRAISQEIERLAGNRN